VRTSSPTEGAFCAKEPAGVTISADPSSGVAVIDARMTSTLTGGDDCTMECGWIDQSLTMERLLPDAIRRFDAVANAVPGCADDTWCDARVRGGGRAMDDHRCRTHRRRGANG
jgi:hypothetical protein